MAMSGEGPLPERLDEVPFDELAALEKARTAEDRRIVSLVEGLDEAALLADLHYRNMAGAARVTQRGRVLAHLFNHQTHHRGQAHALLTRFGHEAPPLDLICFLRR